MANFKVNTHNFTLSTRLLGRSINYRRSESISILRRRRRRILTSSLKWMVEHCSRAPMSLCGFQVTD